MSHVGKDHNMQSSALSQSKNDHSGTLISENGKSLGRSSALGRKHTKEVTQKQYVLHKMEIKRTEITDQ